MLGELGVIDGPLGIGAAALASRGLVLDPGSEVDAKRTERFRPEQLGLMGWPRVVLSRWLAL